MQVSPYEGRVAEFIVRIVMDILGHIHIKDRECVRVERVPTGGRCEFVILDSSELPVLCPQIAF